AMVGVSQGGGLGISIAGLDDRVKLLDFSNPTMSQNAGLHHDRAGGFPNWIKRSRQDYGTLAHELATIAATRYYDAMFFAKRFEGSVFVGLGYEDLVTPAATGFASSNNLRGPKILVHETQLGHPHSPEYWTRRFDLFRRYFPSTLTTAPHPFANTTIGYAVSAGDNVVAASNTVVLSGTIENETVVNDPNINVHWRRISGPGTVSFSDSSSYNPIATFSNSGTYVLQFLGIDSSMLSTDDKFFSLSDHLTVTVQGTNLDSIPPTANLSTPLDTVDGDFVVTVSFSEDITGLTADDFMITNGTVSSLTGTNSIYTFTASPDTAGNVTILLPKETVVDFAGNENDEDSNTLSIFYDLPSTGDCVVPINLALNKPATQHSTQFNAEASRANDGNTNGDFWNGSSTALTNWSNHTWWEVDLGIISNIDSIKIWNRTDCCQNIFQNYYVFVSNNPFTSTGLNSTINQAGVSSFLESDIAGTPTSIEINQQGRYVRVQLAGSGFLGIAEVEVMGCIASGGDPLEQTISFDNLDDKFTTDAPFQIAATANSGLPVAFEIVSGPATIAGNVITLDGTEGTVVVEATQAGNSQFNPATPVQQTFEVIELPPSNCQSAINLALGKTATHSSTQFFAEASRANDGNTDGDFWNGNSVALTNWENNAWWEVDLGFIGEIEAINIWNRTDCCEGLLSDYYIFVSDVPFNSTNLTTTLNQAGVSNYFNETIASTPTETLINRTGRYVRVQLADAAFLAIAEVEVMGCVAAGGTPINQTITFDPIQDVTSNTAPFPMNASATSLLPVTFSVLSGPATIVGDVVTLTGDLGIVEIEATQSGNAQYNPAPPIIQSFEVIEPPVSNCAATANLTIGKTATQSGTQFGAEANRAIDGNTNGNFWAGNSCSLTDWVTNAWWEVDLEVISEIESIKVWNRTDCCTELFSNFYILVADVPFASTNLNATLNQSGVSSYLVSEAAGLPSEIEINTVGRYVRVQLSGSAYLSIAEVEVMGCVSGNGCLPAGTACDDNNATTFDDTEDGDCNCVGIPCPVAGTVCDDGNAFTENDVEDGFCNCAGISIVESCDSLINLAWNQPTAQSSTLTAAQITGDPEKAVDGNTNGVFFTTPTAASSVSATAFGQEEWWEVDLGDLYSIEQMDLYNRTDGQDKTSDVYVLIAENPFTANDLAGARSQADFEFFLGGNLGSPSTIDSTVAGRYVRVQRSTGGYLVLAEVEIWGCAIDNDPLPPSTLIIAPQSDFFHFEAAKKDRSVQLLWGTNSEMQNENFIIEKSSDGNIFEPIKTVESKRDQVGVFFYDKKDDDPFFGKNYYRIQQIFKDGTSRHSSVREINFDIDLTEFIIYPNPAEEQVHVNLKEFLGKNIQIKMLDARGILVSEKNIPSLAEDTITFDLENFTNGIYWLTIKVEGRRMISKSFVISKRY
ncbi:MAG: discoidin domain-containing protein, partial [Bacteroidota bacterium]